jgi:hypothetical protein
MHLSDDIEVKIEGDESPAEKTDSQATETERLRQVLAERAAVQNELLQARRERVGTEIYVVETKAELAQRELRDAIDRGDSEAMAQRHRDLATLEVQRGNLESTAAQLQRTRPVPADPVEAFAAGRTERSASWIRAHPDFVLDGRKQSKLTAAHHDAVGDGLVPDTDAYEAHVEKFIGLRNEGTTRRSSGGNANVPVTVRKSRPGEALKPGEVRMTKGEYEAATETLCWGHDDPHGKFKKNEPIGVAEYLRRKGIMKNTPGWFDRPDSY